MDDNIRRIMIDTETLGTTPDSVVLSIGIVAFNRTDTQARAHFHLDPASQKDRRIDPDTVRWWMQQSAEARKIFAVEQYDTLDAAENYLAMLMESNDEIWANDPDFDLTLLRSLFPKTKWPFWKYRSVRTMKALAGKEFLMNIPEAKFTAHNAIDDAIEQARVVRIILAHTTVAPYKGPE